MGHTGPMDTRGMWNTLERWALGECGAQEQWALGPHRSDGHVVLLRHPTGALPAMSGTSVYKDNT